MHTVAVIGSSATSDHDPNYADGRLLGRLLAEAGLTVVTGGYGGLMEAVSRGAAEAGGQVIGVTAPAVFPARSGPNPHVGIERPAGTITERIHDLLVMADAVIALPGSIGTLTELMMAWNTAFVARFSNRLPQPVVAVGSLWGELVPYLADRLATEGKLVDCVADVREAATIVVDRLTFPRN